MMVRGGFVNRKLLLTCFVVRCPLPSSTVFLCMLLLVSFTMEHNGRTQQRQSKTMIVGWGITAKWGCLHY